MKFLMLMFLVSFNVYGLTAKERFQALPDMYSAMARCGYLGSPKAIVKNAIKTQNLTQLLCLESKTGEINTESTATVTKRTNKKTAKEAINNKDCDELNGFIRNVCIVMQR